MVLKAGKDLNCKIGWLMTQYEFRENMSICHSFSEGQEKVRKAKKVVREPALIVFFPIFIGVIESCCSCLQTRSSFQGQPDGSSTASNWQSAQLF